MVADGYGEVRRADYWWPPSASLSLFAHAAALRRERALSADCLHLLFLVICLLMRSSDLCLKLPGQIHTAEDEKDASFKRDHQRAADHRFRLHACSNTRNVSSCRAPPPTRPRNTGSSTIA